MKMPAVSYAEMVLLRRLVGCISTPGDEDEVMMLLDDVWREAGWHTESAGRQALLARSPKWVDGRPVMLVTAHADSPGFIVSALDEGMKQAVMVALGHPHLPEPGTWADLTVKTASGLVESELSGVEDGDREFPISLEPQIHRGDRAVYSPKFSGPEGESSLIHSPFLDNRIGCWLLATLPRCLDAIQSKANVVLAATASEEFGGFGAAALAHAVPANLIICLDATYENPDQGVSMGQGPVLTLSDASVLIGHTVEEQLDKLCDSWNIPLQKEIYNYSGTDARAFAMAGSTAVILPLLIASQGNHSPQETVSMQDACLLRDLLLKFAGDEEAISMLLAANKFSRKDFIPFDAQGNPQN